MRIALIAPFGMKPKGTVVARMMPLASALSQRGHMVRVVVPPWDDPTAIAGGGVTLPPGAALSDAGAGVHTVTLAHKGRVPNVLAMPYGLVRWAVRPPSSHLPPFTAREQRGELTTFRAEVTHVFKPIGYSGLAGLALSAMRVPWVLDTDDWEGPGGWVGVNPYSPAQKVAITLMEALLPCMAGAVTAASRTLEARTWSFGLPRRRVFYMPNGVSEAQHGWWPSPQVEARRQELAKRLDLDGKPTILLYTRFAEFPYRWPLEVLRRVREAHPDVRLLVVGEGFFGEESKLKEDATREGLGEHIIITGRADEADIPAYLSLGDVALYPMADTLLNRAKSPAKVLEPMVMGLPLVAHRVGQAAEFIGNAGVLVEPGSIAGMAREVSALLSNPQRRAELGAQARQRVWREFNWDRLVEQAECAYRAAIARV